MKVHEALQHARALLASGDIAQAQAICVRLAETADARDAAHAHLVLSACAQRSGDIATAGRHIEAAVAKNPDDALAHYALAEIHERGGAIEQAIESLERAVSLNEAFAAAHQRLGILLGESGRAERAAAAFARVVALEPTNARGFNNLGNALRTLGRMAEAERAFARAVELRPDYQLAIANLALSWRDAGEIEKAERLLREALARSVGKPPLRAIIVMLAGLLRERGALDESEPLYRQAIAMAPELSAGEWYNLGRLFGERDDLDSARDAYRRSHAIDRTDLRGVLAAELSLPMIYRDADDVASARAQFGRALERLHDDVDRLGAGLTADQAIDGLRWTNFLLAYQGGDDRELQISYARFASRMIQRYAPRWIEPRPRRPARARLRVGFASAFFHVGTAGRYFRSWITELDRDRFEVFVYHLYPGMDDIALEIRSRADRFVEFGGSRARPSIVAPVIRADELDVLVYPELGMDHTSFALAALRLAPRQLAGWGHPVTTGHSTIDGFISCAEMEPPGCEGHYAESLLRLPGIGTSYRRLAIPDAVPRARLNLPSDRTLLLCPQSLFKVHPENDELFARVLRENVNATLVMFDGRHRQVTDRFVRRIRQVFERQGVSIEQQLLVLPAVPHEDYLRINLACDAMLDTIHWSGGNTSLDALACGLPIVTLEGAFMRGRQSAAMLRQVGVADLIARDRDDYVRIAGALCRDAAWRYEVSERIRAGRVNLFETIAPLRAFAEILSENT